MRWRLFAAVGARESEFALPCSISLRDGGDLAAKFDTLATTHTSVSAMAMEFHDQPKRLAVGFTLHSTAGGTPFGHLVALIVVVATSLVATYALRRGACPRDAWARIANARRASAASGRPVSLAVGRQPAVWIVTVLPDGAVVRDSSVGRFHRVW